MNIKKVIALARETGCHEASHPMNPWSVTQEALERFANLVRDDVVKVEREACAMAVINIANKDAGNPYKQALRMGAEAIRARGNT